MSKGARSPAARQFRCRRARCTNAPMMSRAAERVCAERGDDVQEGRRCRPRRPWRFWRPSVKMCAGAKLPSSFCSNYPRLRQSLSWHVGRPLALACFDRGITATSAGFSARRVAAQGQVAKETRQIAFPYKPPARNLTPSAEDKLGTVADKEAPLTARALARLEQQPDLPQLGVCLPLYLSDYPPEGTMLRDLPVPERTVRPTSTCVCAQSGNCCAQRSSG